MRFDTSFGGRLRLPLIVAPMFLVSCPSMALGACSQGAMGTFPAHSTRDRNTFEDWLYQMEAGRAEMEAPGPWAVNLVVHHSNPRMEGDLELCVKHKVPVILTSKGAPNDVFDKIHDYGGIALHDVASRRHAEKALEAGADGLIAVCGGAGGHTGKINPFALMNEIRDLAPDVPIVLSGAMMTGRDILAARAMGADLVFMGTRFIPATESLAGTEYRDLLIEASAKDTLTTDVLDGAPTSWLVPSLNRAGIDIDALTRTPQGEILSAQAVRERYSGIFSAGQGVGMIEKSEPVADIIAKLSQEYEDARRAFVV